MPRPLFLLLLATLLWLGAPPDARARAVETRPVWLLSNGFHAALAFRLADAEPWLRALVHDRAARWVLVGWGEREFFMAKPPTVRMAVRAVFLPNESALHVMPLRESPERALLHSDVVRFRFTAAEHRRLDAFLAGEFAHDARGRAVWLGRGFIATSSFYRGSGSFYFPKMCNLWTAQALRRAGVPLLLPGTLWAGGLVWQAEGSGVRIARRSRPADAF